MSTEQKVNEIKGLDPSTWKRIEGSPHLMRKGAVALAKWGAFVLPTHGVVKNKKTGAHECSCDDYSRSQAAKFKREWKPCTKIGKVPWGLKWQDDATNDHEIAYAIWSERKHWNSNIGILCGSRSGLVGLDIDGEVGLASLEKLEAKFGKLPHTVTVVTGSGGRHFWFRLPEGISISNSAKALGAAALGVEATNVDVRGENGQLIAPPSMHKSGNQYRFLEGCGVDDISFDDVPYLPQWLVDECEKAKAGNRSKESGGKAKRTSESSADPFAEAAHGLGADKPNADSFEDGVDSYVARIGDDKDGFDKPIYQAALSYFAKNGIGAPAEEIHSKLTGAILAAECKDSRAVDRYSRDEYLTPRIEQARAYIEANPPSRKRASSTLFADIGEAFRVMNSKTAIVHFKGKTRFLKEGKNGEVDFQTEHDAKLSYAPYKLKIKKTKGRGTNVEEVEDAIPLLPLWTQSNERREYTGVMFDPGEKAPQDGSSPDHVYNLWKGFAIEPAKPGEGSWRLMQRHWFNVMCNGDEAQFVWWCAWWADILQTPAHKLGSSIVAIGAYGTGKSLVSKMFRRIMGKHYTYIDDEHGLTGNFNAHFEVALLVDVAEAYFSGNMKIIGKIKSLITADVIPFERKNIDKMQVDNFSRFYQTANPNKENKIIFAEEGERRYFVTEVGNQHAKDSEYFGPLVAEIEGDGPAAMMRDLLALDISDVDLTNPPLTPAFGEQVAANMSQKEKWWMEVLETGTFPQKEYHNEGLPPSADLVRWETEGLNVDKQIVFDSFNSRVRPYGAVETDARTIGKVLRDMIPGLVETRPLMPNGKRIRCFGFPPLTKLREDFTARTQIRLGGDMDKDAAAKVTKADLQDPFFAAGYEMVADAVIDEIFGREVSGIDSDEGDSDGPYIKALLLRDRETGELRKKRPWMAWCGEAEGCRPSPFGDNRLK